MGAAITAGLFFLISVAVLGTDVAQSFLSNMGLARWALETGILPLTKMPTVFALLRLLGFSVAVSFAAHAFVAASVVAVVATIWWQRKPYFLRAAALMTGTLLISPYLFDYDLVWLAFPLAWIGMEAVKTGWLRGEREVLFVAWLAPILVSVIASTGAFQPGPLIVIALFFVIVRRSRVSVKHTDEYFPTIFDPKQNAVRNAPR
jgi:hypothetical protein